MTPGSSATHCVLCGADAMLAPRVHLRDLVPGEPARDVTLGLCELHGSRLRKGELRVLGVVEGWLASEGRLNPSNPLAHVRLVPFCLACDAPLASGAPSGAAGSAGAPPAGRRLRTGEVVVECSSCPAINVLDQVGGDPVAVQLHASSGPRA